LNPKISQYNLKSKIYPKGRSTLGMPGVPTKRQQKKWKPKK
jgi:excinuclease ABC subunit B